MIVYYAEVNAICIIFLMLLRFPLKHSDTNSSEQRTLTLLIWSTIWLCAADMIAGIFRGMMFPGARAIIEISNDMYFLALAFVSYLWCVYAFAKLTLNGVFSRKQIVFSALPVVGFTVITLLNPAIHFLFSITSENLYKRGNGVYLHWVIVWSYFLVPSAVALHRYIKETSAIKKQEIRPLLLFAVLPFIASMIQMVFYGVTTTQVGVTLSIAMICLHSQDSQILTDALTGINNRRAMEAFVENQVLHNKNTAYTLIMIDVDKFKQINDKYGHMVGDLVLKKIAIALKEACKPLPHSVQLSRFGGDEFVILGVDCSEKEADFLVKGINAEIEKETAEEHFPCKISVSIGCVQGKCGQEKEFRELFKQADLAMYKAKAARAQTTK